MKLGETTEAAALRELKEETGLDGEDPRLIGVYSKPDRDPRHQCISAAYLVFVNATTPAAGDDAASAEFIEDCGKLSLAFDHNEILRDALQLRVSLQAIMGKHS